MIKDEEIKDWLEYLPETGDLIWKKTRRQTKAGTIAGSICTNGYRKITLDGKIYLEHRLAWFLTYGRWPNEWVDHINGVRNDNRITNLREVSKRENRHNTPLQRDQGRLYGCSKQGSKWRVRVVTNNVAESFGLYTTQEEAHEVYKQVIRSIKLPQPEVEV